MRNLGINSFLCVIIVVGLLSETDATEKQPKASQPYILLAKYTKYPVKIDGILDDACWKEAEVYKLSLGMRSMVS